MSDKVTAKPPLDLAAIRESLRNSRGREYWKSLEQLAGTEEFRDYLENEFPRLSSALSDAMPRRDVLRLMGASLALAGMSACTQAPLEKIVPFVRAPEDVVPGKPLFYATATTLGGYATGVLVESHTGRPTKIEGNTQHPASRGALDPFSQASILSLYDPDRSQNILHNGRIASWVSFVAAMNTERERLIERKGAGLRILTGTVTSPTLAAQIRQLLAEMPEARWHQYEPAGGHAARAGAKLAFGTDVSVVFRVAKADVILSLNSDFLSSGPGSLSYARDWASRRNPELGRAGLNRLYVAESTPTNTGASADHRLPLRAAELENFARAVARAVGVDIEAPAIAKDHEAWVKAVAEDLKAHRGAGLVIAGSCGSPALQVLAHAMNQALENVGKTVDYIEPVEASPVDQLRSIVELSEDLKAGKVEAIAILGVNPAFDAPADLDFALHLTKVKTRLHLGLYLDETAYLCNWHVPEAHYLESWGDAKAFDGTATIQQPLIAPLYEGKSVHEIVSVLLGKSGLTSHDIVQENWKLKQNAAGFDRFWQTSLHDGAVVDSAHPVKPVSLQPGWQKLVEKNGVPGTPGEIEIVFRADPSVYDGRFANNGWLQELPKPLTKLTWDNAALVSPATAERLGLDSRDVVELRFRDRSVMAPVWILPGQPRDSVTVHLGYGRTHAGKLGTGAGFNAYSLRTSDRPWFASGLAIRKTGSRAVLACTQNHQSMEGRALVREGTIGEYEHDPRFVKEMGEDPAKDFSLYPGFEYKGYAWGMAVNLNACIGCNACTIACQAENNIPVVGKEQVDRGREMHWIRVDRYFKGDLENPSATFQPVMCQHCENAPCEPVCPVAATNHSSEGLNQMVYNRCVGTRYCSNNCPYKVRRFNFLQYTDWETPSLKPLRNPDVTVRGRGVMEKCTYCVQRINSAKILSEKEDRQVRDGEIVTACQSACPTGAIVFGNVNDPESRVAKLKAQPLNYGLLADLNTQPRTSYLARLRNPNPALEKE